MYPQVVKMEPPGPSNHRFSSPASHHVLVDRGAGGSARSPLNGAAAGLSPAYNGVPDQS